MTASLLMQFDTPLLKTVALDFPWEITQICALSVRRLVLTGLGEYGRLDLLPKIFIAHYSMLR